MPLWIQILQALLTPAIAVAVGVIAFRQWRTAHQKVVLDLFDRRLKIYEGVTAATFRAVNAGIIGAMGDAVSAVSSHAHEARFLFGPEIENYLSSIVDEITNLRRQTRILESRRATDEARDAAADECSASEERLLEKIRGMQVIFGPYMRMRTKVVPTPSEWIAELNRRRLSYADEKQK